MEKKNELVKTGTELVDGVQSSITALVQSNRLNLPEKYSVANALRAAWLILQEIQDKDHQPALEVCDRKSISKSLLRMVVLGLNPIKKQCYFIVRGKTLCCDTSYFGDIAILKRVSDIVDVVATVIHKGDDVQIEMISGRPVVSSHKTKLENMTAEIVAAYCIITHKSGLATHDFMTMDRIAKSWSKSKTGGAVHREFPDEMAKRTIIRHAIKKELNSSDDNDLLIEEFNKQPDDQEVETVTEQAESQRTAPILDVAVIADQQGQEQCESEAVKNDEVPF